MQSTSGLKLNVKSVVCPSPSCQVIKKKWHTHLVAIEITTSTMYRIWSRTFSCFLKWCLNSKATKNKWLLSFFSSCWDKLPKKIRLKENEVCSGSQSEGAQSTMVEKLRWQELEASHPAGKEGWMPSAAQVLLPAHTVQNPKQKMIQCTIKTYPLLINIIQIIPYNTGSLPS